MSDHHEQLREDTRNLEKKFDAQSERWFEWADSQDSKRAEFEDKILGKIDSLKDSISQKTEMDSAMIAQLSSLAKRVDVEETKREGCDQVIYETSFQVKSLVERLARHDLGKMESDITAAHDRVRDHEERIRPLEKKEGKLARAVLERLALTAAGGVAGYVVTRLVGG
jgi:chromosome segregation ATPase